MLVKQSGKTTSDYYFLIPVSLIAFSLSEIDSSGGVNLLGAALNAQYVCKKYPAREMISCA